MNNACRMTACDTTLCTHTTKDRSIRWPNLPTKAKRMLKPRRTPLHLQTRPACSTKISLAARLGASAAAAGEGLPATSVLSAGKRAQVAERVGPEERVMAVAAAAVEQTAEHGAAAIPRHGIRGEAGTVEVAGSAAAMAGTPCRRCRLPVSRRCAEARPKLKGSRPSPNASRQAS